MEIAVQPRTIGATRSPHGQYPGCAQAEPVNGFSKASIMTATESRPGKARPSNQERLASAGSIVKENSVWKRKLTNVTPHDQLNACNANEVQSQ